MAEIALEITPVEVKAGLDRGEYIRLIDVREPEEHAICQIDGAELIPMRTIPEQLQNLDSDDPDVVLCVFCHHGVRSLSVVDWLRRQGVDNCQSMAGGIDRWSREIDPEVRRY
jgi:rhodanese-related sulfurtransferase